MVRMDPWSLNLRHLRALAAIARLGSISAAAAEVNLTQPAITQAIAKLETQLGLALFDRRPDGMGATPAGLLLAARAAAAHARLAAGFRLPSRPENRVTMAQLRALIALAGAGSYVSASAATGLSQPSLHRAISDLETASGLALVERRGRGVMLTDSGRRTARAFRLARAELVSGLSEIAALAGRETGRIAIGAMPLPRARFLPRVVAAFHRLHPDSEIAIVEGSHAELVEPLRDGDLDLLVGALRDPVSGEDLVQTALFEDRPVIIGRAGHPLAVKAPPLVDVLARYPWTVAAPGTPLRAQWEHMFSDAGVPPPRVPIECGSVITIRGILLDSDFLTLLSPDQVAVELEAGWLVKICDTPADMVRAIGLTTRAGWMPTAMQAEFLALAQEMAATPGETLPEN